VPGLLPRLLHLTPVLQNNVAAHACQKLPHLLGALHTSCLARHAKICLRSKGRVGCTSLCRSPLHSVWCYSDPLSEKRKAACHADSTNHTVCSRLTAHSSALYIANQLVRGKAALHICKTVGAEECAPAPRRARRALLGRPFQGLRPCRQACTTAARQTAAYNRVQQASFQQLASGPVLTARACVGAHSLLQDKVRMSFTQHKTYCATVAWRASVRA